MIKVVGGFWEAYLTQMLAIFYKIAKCNIVNCAHIYIYTRTHLLSFVFTLAFGLSQQHVKLLQIIAWGQPLLLSVRCCLILSAWSLWNSKFLLYIFHYSLRTTMILPDYLHVVEISICSAFLFFYFPSLVFIGIYSIYIYNNIYIISVLKYCIWVLSYIRI